MNPYSKLSPKELSETQDLLHSLKQSKLYEIFLDEFNQYKETANQIAAEIPLDSIENISIREANRGSVEYLKTILGWFDYQLELTIEEIKNRKKSNER